MDIISLRYQMWELQRSIAKSVQTLFAPLVAQSDLAPQQVAVLLELSQNGPRRMGELADILCLTNTNISPLCKCLESMGYLVRQRSDKDERIVLVSLSPKGEEFVQTLENSMEQRLQPFLQQHQNHDFPVILEGMRQLDSLLKEICLSLEEPADKGE